MRQKLAFSQAAVYDRSRVYVIGYSQAEESTRVFRWTGKWDNYLVPFPARQIGAVRGQLPEIVTVSRSGKSMSRRRRGSAMR